MSFVKRNYIDGETVITAENLNDIQDAIIQIVPDDVKQALLQIASKVAYIDEHGQDYYDALESALYPDATLVSISAVYTQSGTVYDTDSLDSLKADLVVTAHFDDSSTEVVTLYTLSGTLTAGTSTITVAYGGKTTTFNVTVAGAFTWTYADGLPADNGFTKTVTGNCTETMTTDGVIITAPNSSSSIRYERENSKQNAFLEYVVNLPVNNSNHYARISNDSYGIGIRVQYSSGYKGIYIRTASVLADMTLVQSVSLNTNYKIKLVLNGDKGDVYVNDVLKLSNIDLSTMIDSVGGDSKVELKFLAAGSSSANTLFKSCTIGAL